MEARSRLSQTGTPSVIVYLNKSDLSDASGDVVNIFLSALNTPDYRLAMSVRTNHLVEWTQRVQDQGDAFHHEKRQKILSNYQVAEMKKDPSVSDIIILQDEGMYLSFFAADQDAQQEIAAMSDQETRSEESNSAQSQSIPESTMHSGERRGNLEGFMRPKS